MGTSRDEFTEKTKHTLCLRVGARCSEPGCRRLTVGPNSTVTKATIIGVAAHITAAAQGGPRFDPTLTSQQRSHISNGIWLCATHASLIDKDEHRYPVEVLRQWKNVAEDAAAADVAANPEAVEQAYEQFVEPYLKLEPDNTFRHFGATVSYDAWTMTNGIVMVRLAIEGDVPRDFRVILGNLSVRSYLRQHLHQANYMQMLMRMTGNRLKKIAGTFSGGQEDNYSNFQHAMTSIDWSAFPMFDGLVFDVIAGVIDGEYRTFLFDLTPFVLEP